MNDALPFRVVLIGMLTILLPQTMSYEMRRPGVDYRFNEKPEGWYFLIWDQPNAEELPIVGGRLQVEFPRGSRIIFTSSKPTFGWAKDKKFIQDREVDDRDLGNGNLEHYGERMEGGKTVLKFTGLYCGDSNEYRNNSNSDEILDELLLKEETYKQ